MNASLSKIACLALNAAVLGVVLCAQAQAATVKLDPLFATSPMALASGGLAGAWYKVQNDAKFSEAQWQGGTIKDTTWGTGIWAATDIPAIAADPRPSYVTDSTTSIGAVSYANNIYNNNVASGMYGSWSADHARSLAPSVGASNACNMGNLTAIGCANEQNYAAIFTGYLYVAQKGLYDFGVFADDVFSFSLTGLDGMYGMSHNAVAGSPGRVLDSLLMENALDGLELNQGFYGIGLSYANRLEAGVIDLGWTGPGDIGWRTISDKDLYNRVPEPATLVLVALGLMGLWGARKRVTTVVSVLAA
jgi:hypothetical protein